MLNILCVTSFAMSSVTVLEAVMWVK